MPARRESERPIPMRPAKAYRSHETEPTGGTVTAGSAQEIAGFGETPSPITREILESFLACKTEAYLKLHGQRGIKADYEALSAEIKAELRDRASENLVSRLKPEDVMRGVKITETVLGSGAAIILDVTVEFGDLSLCCDALKRVKGESRLGGFHYAPVMVYEGASDLQVGIGRGPM